MGACLKEYIYLGGYIMKKLNQLIIITHNNDYFLRLFLNTTLLVSEVSTQLLQTRDRKKQKDQEKEKKRKKKREDNKAQ